MYIRTQRALAVGVSDDYLSTHPENRELYDQMYRAELNIQFEHERDAARRRR